MRKKQTLRSEEGFTLIEIIAVLVVLGILAAVAVPKYIDMTTEAKKQAAKGQIAEMKSTLNLAYAKYFMENEKAPTASQTVTAAGFTSGTAANVGTAPDIWNVTLTATDDENTHKVKIEINNRNDDSGYSATGDIDAGEWHVPSS